MKTGHVESQTEPKDRARTEPELEEKLRFQMLLAEVSTRFINLPAEQISSEISTAQRLICKILDLDRCAFRVQVFPKTVFPLDHEHRRDNKA